MPTHPIAAALVGATLLATAGGAAHAAPHATLPTTPSAGEIMTFELAPATQAETAPVELAHHPRFRGRFFFGPRVFAPRRKFRRGFRRGFRQGFRRGFRQGQFRRGHFGPRPYHYGPVRGGYYYY